MKYSAGRITLGRDLNCIQRSDSSVRVMSVSASLPGLALEEKAHAADRRRSRTTSTADDMPAEPPPDREPRSLQTMMDDPPKSTGRSHLRARTSWSGVRNPRSREDVGGRSRSTGRGPGRGGNALEQTSCATDISFADVCIFIGPPTA